MSRVTSSADRQRLGALIDRVAVEAGIARADLIGPSRRSDLVWTRFAVVWVGHADLRIGWAELGRQLGDRDPATIIHAYRRAASLRDADARFRDLTDRLVADRVDGPAA